MISRGQLRLAFHAAELAFTEGACDMQIAATGQHIRLCRPGLDKRAKLLGVRLTAGYRNPWPTFVRVTEALTSGIVSAQAGIRTAVGELM